MTKLIYDTGAIPAALWAMLHSTPPTSPTGVTVTVYVFSFKVPPHKRGVQSAASLALVIFQQSLNQKQIKEIMDVYNSFSCFLGHSIVQFQKISIPTLWKVNGNSEGVRGLKSQIFKRKYGV